MYKQCCEAVSFHGRVCVIGMTTQDFTYNHHAISYKEITVVGARNSNRQDFLDNIDSLVTGKIGVEYINRMITAEYDFEDAIQMYKDMETEYGNNMKVVLKFAKDIG